MKKILVLCTGNSCRSQIAEGYLRHFTNGKALIYSGGIETHGVNPKAIAVMAEEGIDISTHTSNNVDEYMNIPFDYVITVCDNANESCPFFPSEAILPTKKQPDLKLSVLNKHTESSDHLSFIQPCMEGKNIGLMSEAGCPGVADPGAAIVKIAHEKGIQVVPLVGPSSILLAIMASGMNGQSFAFNGYLPIDKSDKKSALKNFEQLSQNKSQSQLFIETPYRNNKLMEDILATLQPNTHLCIACDITLPTEYIKTKTISQWKKEKVDLHNRPCIFIVHRF